MDSHRCDDLRSRLVTVDPEAARVLEEQAGIAPGTLIDGRYAPEAHLHTSALATVIQAWDTAFCRKVAVKLALPSDRSDGRGSERVHREGIALDLVSSPHVVRRLGMGQDPVLGWYVVTEFLEGQILSAATSQRLSVRRAVEITCGMLEGLESCHRARVVQLDLKPDNVVLVPFGAGDLVVLFDFNVVVLPGEDRELYARSGIVMGTPGYFAPEQVAGRPIDGRTNVYVAGLILYELLIDARAFRGWDSDEIVAEMMMRTDWPICAIRPEVPRALEEVVQRALNLNPRERFQTARAFQQALEPFLACEPSDESTG